MPSPRVTVVWLAACADAGPSAEEDHSAPELAKTDAGKATNKIPGLLVPPQALARESSWCWFLAPVEGRLGLFAVGMDSGIHFAHSRYDAVHSLFHTAGMAWTGTSLVAGGYNGLDFHWHALDLASGELTIDPSPGYGADRGVSWLMPGGIVAASYDNPLGLDLYEDFSALAAGESRGSLPLSGPFHRFQLDGTTLYVAGQSTREILVYDVVTGRQTGSIPLEGYDTWVWGIGIAGGMLHLMDDGRSEPGQSAPRIARFDLRGNALNDVTLEGFPPAHRPSGLWCDAP